MPNIDICDENIIKSLLDYQSLKKQNFNIPGGLCFGSALCHSIFAYLGKLKWWTVALESVVSWNRDASSLSNPVQLPDYEKQYTLDHIFKMVAYYLLNHDEIDLLRNNFEIEKISNNPIQTQLLSPGSKLTVTTDHDTKKIVDSLGVVVHGNEDLEVFLQKLKTHYDNNGILCLVFTNDHATSLRYKKNLYFFNSNWGDSKLTSVKRGWSHISSIWHFLKLYMGEDKTMGIVLASLDAPINMDLRDTCNDLTKKSIDCLNTRTIELISNFRPDYLPGIFNKIDNDKSTEMQFSDCLKKRILKSPSTLQSIISCAPQLTVDLLKLIAKKPLLLETLAIVLPQKVDSFADFSSSPNPDIEDCRTTLDILIKYAPQAMDEFLKMAAVSESLKNSTRACLLNEIKKGVTLLDQLTSEHSAFLPKFAALIGYNNVTDPPRMKL